MKAAGAGVEQQRRDQGFGLEMLRQESVGAGDAEAGEQRLGAWRAPAPSRRALLQRAPPPAPQLPRQAMQLAAESRPGFGIGSAEDAQRPRRVMRIAAQRHDAAAPRKANGKSRWTKRKPRADSLKSRQQQRIQRIDRTDRFRRRGLTLQHQHALARLRQIRRRRPGRRHSHRSPMASGLRHAAIRQQRQARRHNPPRRCPAAPPAVEAPPR